MTVPGDKIPQQKIVCMLMRSDEEYVPPTGWAIVEFKVVVARDNARYIYVLLEEICVS